MAVSLALARNVVLGTTNVFALIILGLAAFTLTQTPLGYYFTFSALGVSTSLIHMLSTNAMLITGRLRDGAFTSRVSWQVGWLSYLAIMWLATGAQTASILSLFVACDLAFCGASQGIAALGFINWAILSGYVFALTTAAVRAGQAGKSVWAMDVKHLRWTPGPINFEKPLNTLNSAAGTYLPQAGNPNYSNPPMAPQLQPQPTQASYTQPTQAVYLQPTQPDYTQSTDPSYPPPQSDYQYNGTAQV